eukprot:1803521-Alexandrium_andersonii.AAC.1
MARSPPYPPPDWPFFAPFWREPSGDAMRMVAAPRDVMRAAAVTLQRVVRGWLLCSIGRRIAGQARANRLGRFEPRG